MRFSSTLLLMLALAAGLIFAARGSPGQPPPKPRRNGLPPTIRPPTRCRRRSWQRQSHSTGRASVLTVAASVWWLLQLLVVAGHGRGLRGCGTSPRVLQKRRWLQCYVFWVACCSPCPAQSATGNLWALVALRDGLSVQGWGSWLGDRVSCWGLNGASAGWWRC